MYHASFTDPNGTVHPFGLRAVMIHALPSFFLTAAPVSVSRARPTLNPNNLALVTVTHSQGYCEPAATTSPVPLRLNALKDQGSLSVTQLPVVLVPRPLPGKLVVALAGGSVCQEVFKGELRVS